MFLLCQRLLMVNSFQLIPIGRPIIGQFDYMSIIANNVIINIPTLEIFIII